MQSYEVQALQYMPLQAWMQFQDIEFTMACIHCYLFCELICENTKSIGMLNFVRNERKWKSIANKFHGKVKVEDKANEIGGQYKIVIRLLLTLKQRQSDEKKLLLHHIYLQHWIASIRRKLALFF